MSNHKPGKQLTNSVQVWKKLQVLTAEIISKRANTEKCTVENKLQYLNYNSFL
jgi:hypothetical protein